MTTKSIESNFPYWQIEKKDQSAIAKELRKKYKEAKTYAGLYKQALQHLGPNPPQEKPSVEVQQVIEALNSKAREVLEAPFVTPWKEEMPVIQVLTYLLPYAAHAATVSGMAVGGISLLYLRSQTVIALANICGACAFLVLRSNILNLNKTFGKIHNHISQLNWQNQTEFSSQIDAAYKASYLMRLYFGAHSRKMSKDHQGLNLLKEQLSAINHIKFLLIKLYMMPGSDLKLEGIQIADLGQIKAFFVKFERICRKGMLGTVGVAMVALAWAYYAYVQKAYLMTIAGMVHFVGGAAISWQLFKLQKISKNIHLSNDDVAVAIQKAASESFLLRRIGVADIHKAVVIPFDAILKLIPAWKESVK